MAGLDNYFWYEHRPGYVRWMDGDSCTYVEEKEMKRILLEKLEAVKYTKVIGECRGNN